MPNPWPRALAPRSPRGPADGRPYAGGAAFAAVLCAAGCTPPTPAGDASFFGQDRPITVQDVRSGLIEAGRTITLYDLVVTVPRLAGGRDLWLQDPAGGAYGGLRVYFTSPRPELQPARGALLNLVGTVGSRAGHIVLIVEESHAVVTIGSATAAVNPIGPMADFGPWIDSLVSVDATVVGCGDAAGTQPLDVGAQSAPVQLDPTRAGLRLGAGAARQGLRGVLQGLSEQTRLMPLDAADAGVAVDPALDPAAGCAADAWSLRAAPRDGWVQLDDAVVTAVGEGGLWLQPLGGGPGLRMLAAGGGAPPSIGDRVGAWALASAPLGVTELRLLRPDDLWPLGAAAPEAWTLDALGADPRLAGVVDPAPDGGSPDSGVPDSGSPEGAASPALAWASGALVQLGPLQTGSTAAAGRVETSVGVPIDTRLYGGAPPTDAALDRVVGVLDVSRVDSALLPRSAADIVGGAR